MYRRRVSGGDVEVLVEPRFSTRTLREPVVATESHAYWGDREGITQYDLASGESSVLCAVSASTRMVGVEGDWLYWWEFVRASDGQSHLSLMRAPLDCAFSECVVCDSDVPPFRALIDGDVVIWASDSTLQIVDTDTAEVSTLLVGLPWVGDLAADDDHVFFAAGDAILRIDKTW